MEASFWHERWEKGDIGFHRDVTHASLGNHWAALDVPPPATVLVPLCGKSLDMAWLVNKGYKILGVELSQLAIDAFFASQNLTPTIRTEGPHTINTAGPYELWCGDIFKLPAEALRGIAAVYDRASLVAFPPGIQGSYANWLSTMAGSAPILLVGLSYDESEMNGPPFSIPEARVRELLSRSFDLDILSNEDVMEANSGLMKRGLTALQETVYVARRKT